MRRSTTLLVSGIVTAFVMVLVIGLAAAGDWLGTSAQAAAPAAGGQVEATRSTDGQVGDVARLQQEVTNYRTQLQDAYDKLQVAYDEIAQLQAQQQADFSGAGRRHEREQGFEGFSNLDGHD